MNTRALGVVAAVCLAMGGTAWPQAGAFTAAERKRIGESLPKAEQILLSAATSENATVKAAAARMLRYAPTPEAWRAVRSLFGDFGAAQTEPGFPLFRDAALGTLLRLDAEATVEALLAAQPGCWSWIDPAALFAVIGTEHVGRFSNLFYHAETGSPDTVFRACLLAGLYAQTRDAKYLELLTFHEYGPDADAEELLRLYRRLSAAGLPVDRVACVMKARGGILEGHMVTSRSYTREELLYQALLIRLGIGPAALAPEAPAGDPYLELEPAAMRAYGLPAPIRRPETDPTLYFFLPSISMNLAAASFYAGRPEQKHLEAFRANIGSFPPVEQSFYADVVVRSPASPLRTACLGFLLSRPDPILRRLAVAGYLATPTEEMPAVLLPLLDTDGDVPVRAAILQLIGGRGEDRITLRLCDFLDPGTEPLLQVTAAGALLAAHGGRR